MVLQDQVPLKLFNTQIYVQGMEYVGVLYHCLVPLLI
jgi:hypothetical protein